MKRNISRMLGLLLLVSMLGGCSAVQLEERNFPMLAAVDDHGGLVEFTYGFPALSQKDNTDMAEAKVNVPMTAKSSFSEALSDYERQMSKKADCNHLKVLVLGKNFVEERKAFDEMLVSLKKTELFPRNTYVCVTGDVESLLAVEENLPEDLGTYLEMYLENHESDQQIKLINLGKLLDERENRKEAINIPCLGVENDAIVPEGIFTVDFR